MRYRTFQIALSTNISDLFIHSWPCKFKSTRLAVSITNKFNVNSIKRHLKTRRFTIVFVKVHIVISKYDNFRHLTAFFARLSCTSLYVLSSEVVSWKLPGAYRASRTSTSEIPYRRTDRPEAHDGRAPRSRTFSVGTYVAETSNWRHKNVCQTRLCSVPRVVNPHRRRPLNKSGKNRNFERFADVRFVGFFNPSSSYWFRRQTGGKE